jgi:hypothetical protein
MLEGIAADLPKDDKRLIISSRHEAFHKSASQHYAIFGTTA